MYKLYTGNETYLSLIEAKNFANTLYEDNVTEYISLDVEKIKAEKIVDLLSSNSLFNTKRVILLKRVYRNKEKDLIIPFLLEYLQNESNDHIILWEDQKISSVTKYIKFFKKNNQLEEYTKLNKRTFLTWAKKIVKDEELEIDSKAFILLIQYSNYDTERFKNNIKKLKLIEKELIQENDIKEFSPNTYEEDIWKLLDKINSETGKSFYILENLFKQEVDPNYIISMIARNVRLIAMTKYMIKNKIPYSEIASTLKVPIFALKPIIDASQRYSEGKVLAVYEKLSSLDYEIKVGGIEPKLGLTLLCTIL